MTLNRLSTAFAVMAMAFATMWADAPTGYYDSCKGKSGAALLKALESKIGSHTNVGYDGLFNVYKTSDAYPDGKLWDMYSTIHWNPSNKCGNYSGVGSCYNREHSFPKSWFSKGSPMVSDAFHIYPTDGQVNGIRSNYPYGEVKSNTSSKLNDSRALGKLGKCSFPGYSGTVFEPDDQYKGDFARSYFYMAACYNSRISGWSSPMLAGNAYPAFSSWAVELLLKWHREDPVSKKETDRNDAVYKHQRNRNPFIDNPEMVEHIWGNQKTVGWNGNNGGGTPSTGTPVLTSPVNGQSLDLGTAVTGGTVSQTLSIRGKDLTQPLAISISGAGFKCSATSVSAASVNAGTSVTISYSSATEGESSGTIRLTSADINVAISLHATAFKGLPAAPATGVYDTGFTANWVNISDDEPQAQYYFYVMSPAGMLPGYPKMVNAADEHVAVTDVEPETEYRYFLQYQNMTSNTVTVTTLAEDQELSLDPDADLLFVTDPGKPSTPVAIMVNAANVGDAITIDVEAPFEVSTDLSQWSTTLTLTGDDDHFYLRVNAAEAGIYHTDITARAGNVLNDDLIAEARVGSAAIDAPATEPMLWEAYNLEGDLAVDIRDTPRTISIYTTDARTVTTAVMPVGITRLTLAPGLYIVVCDDRARRVFIR